MKTIPFMKMNGCGNDFIVVDDRKEKLMKSFNLSDFVKHVCKRRVSVGADGVIVIKKSDKADFIMRYFNADGSEGEMCGNGARCVSMFAYLMGIVKSNMKFETIAGIYESQIKSENSVKVKFPRINIENIKLNQKYNFNDNIKDFHYALVGVPHIVLFEKNVKEIKDSDFISMGRKIRYTATLFPDGTNVNFIQVMDRHNIIIRTYERGVEDETFACGTGATASVIVSGMLDKVDSPVRVHTQGGILTVYYLLKGKYIDEVYLEGNVRIVVQGYLLPSSWE